MDLCFLSALAGIFLLVATMGLIYKRRIYLDSQTRAPVEFEFPLLGKVKTQTPVIAVILVGAGLVTVPMFQSSPRMARIEGNLKTNGQAMTVLLVGEPSYNYHQEVSGAFSHKIPLLPDPDYRVFLLVKGKIVDSRMLRLNDNKLDIGTIEYFPAEDLQVAREGGVQ